MANEITATDIESEDWSAVDAYSPAECECTNGHVFTAKAKFSGYLIAMVSKTPCPACGSYQLRRVAVAGEQQVFCNKDVGPL